MVAKKTRSWQKKKKKKKAEKEIPERKAWNWKDVNEVLWKPREERASGRRHSMELSFRET